MLSSLIEPGSVTELRIPNGRAGTASGYFDDMDAMAKCAMEWSGKAPGVYFMLNPINPDLLTRSPNRITERAVRTTSDNDILRRLWLPIDFDPVRASGISSTDAEHAAALERAEACRTWLAEQGWPAPILADSGNGAHLLYRIDLPNDAAALKLVGDCLKAVEFQFGDDLVSVDLKTGNAARIWKLYGTLAAKGDDTPDRPHRPSRMVTP